MLKRHFLLQFILLCVGFSLGSAQIGPVEVIDNSYLTVGISQIVSADLNNDNHDDIVFSATGSSGRLAYCLNTGNSSFEAVQIVDSLSFTKGVVAGDFNNDGWMDLVSIGNISYDVNIHYNENGSFGERVLVDSGIFPSINEVVAADFDEDGDVDLVVIGQHSIDHHRNLGEGVFEKEHILTTSSSEQPLELLDISVMDMDDDGDLDLVCGETAGLVTYVNSGQAVFSPVYHSIVTEIVWRAHPFDINGDSFPDVIFKNSFGEVKWFRNDGSGNLNFVAILPSFPDFNSLRTVDFNNDGALDAFVSYPNNISVFLNNSQHDFSEEYVVYQDNALYMDEISTMDINNDGREDYIWSGMTHTLAFHLNTNSVGIAPKRPSELASIYPNPSNNYFSVSTHMSGKYQLKVYNIRGQVVLETSEVYSGTNIHISQLPPGIYISVLSSEIGQYSSKLVVR